LPHDRWIRYGLGKPGASLRTPFDPGIPVLFVASRMFALFSHLQGRPYVNLKADPEESRLLRMQYPDAIIPGCHMNKRHWNTVFLDAGLPDEEIRCLMDASYNLVLQKLTRAEKAGLARA